MIGMYRALFEANIQADFIHPDEIAAGLGSRYRVIFLGAPLMLSRPMAEALKAFVRQGGTLISEARPAWNDERGFANDRIPGAGLDEVFGCREALLESSEAVEMRMEKDLPPALAPLAGKAVAGTMFAEHLEPASAGARVLGSFPARGQAGNTPPNRGRAAIVLSKYGSGQAVLIGSFPAAAYDQDPEKLSATGELLRGLVALGGVGPAIGVSGAPGLVEARMLESSDALLLIALNHDSVPQEVTFSFGRDVPTAEWLNMETGQVVQFVGRAAGSTYTHRFAPRDALVLVIGKRRR
jgi:hypothetical protein